MRTQSTIGKIAAATHAPTFGVTYLILRLAMGVLFLATGWKKIVGDWSAESYLLAANGPFAEWFRSLAGSSVIDLFNAWGLFCLGLALLLGILVRPAAILGVILMTLYYFAHFFENTAGGYVDQHIVYAAALLLFAAGGAGHAFGLNAIVLGNIRKPNRIVRWLFG